jgi:cell division protein FtsB
MADQLAQDPDSRAEFEAWASHQGYAFGYGGDGVYDVWVVSRWWEAWQAATQRQQERIAALEADIAHKDAYAEQLGRELAKADAERQALEAQVQALSLDAGRWQAMRQCLVGADFAPEMGGGPVVMFELYAKSVNAGPEGADAIADAAIAAGKGEAS